MSQTFDGQMRFMGKFFGVPNQDMWLQLQFISVGQRNLRRMGQQLRSINEKLHLFQYHSFPSFIRVFSMNFIDMVDLKLKRKGI